MHSHFHSKRYIRSSHNHFPKKWGEPEKRQSNPRNVSAKLEEKTRTCNKDRNNQHGSSKVEEPLSMHSLCPCYIEWGVANTMLSND
jgi:hypothetical protein